MQDQTAKARAASQAQINKDKAAADAAREKRIAAAKAAREADEKEHQAAMKARRELDQKQSEQHKNELLERKAEFEKTFKHLWGSSTYGQSVVYATCTDADQAQKVIVAAF